MSSSTSGSTTISEFMLARMRKQVPVFGGDPRVGIQQFGAAVNTSAMGSINTTIDSLALQLKQLAGRTTVQHSAIQLVENITEIDDAAELEDDKIEALLSASMIDPRDTTRYLALLKVARDGIKKRRVAQDQQLLRKKARLKHGSSMDVSQYVTDDMLPLANPIISMFGITDVDDRLRRYLVASITHESIVAGREVNRVLAFIGSAVMKLVVADHAFQHLQMVSDVNNVIQSQQSNMALRDKAINMGLDNCIRLSGDVDKASKSVVTTAFEAVIGSLYMLQGYDAVVRVNEHVRFFEHDATPVVAQTEFSTESPHTLHDRVKSMTTEEFAQFVTTYQIDG